MSDYTIVIHMTGKENGVGLRIVENSGLQNMFCMGILSVPRAEFGLSQISDYRGVGLGRFHCICSY